MATLKPVSEFLEMIKMESKNFSNYKRRGKVIVQDKFIDLELPVNELFLKERLAYLKKQEAKADNQNKVPPLTSDNLPSITARKMGDDPEADNLYKLELSIKKGQDEKLKKENRLKELEILKREGNSLPMDDVKLIFGQTFKAIVSSFRNGAHDLITQYQHQYDLSREDAIELKARFDSILNNNINEAKETATSSIKNLIDDYKEHRTQGQRQ